MISEEKKVGRIDNREIDIVFSKTINAGKRIYYIDVKQNRKGELYLSITESKKVTSDDLQTVRFEKFKIFLYKEDLDKFSNALGETIDYIKANNTVDFKEPRREEQPIRFDDKFRLNFDDF
ncbi:MAG: PUR family DNA/RNA-binding protein [Dysgonamonadaceae bacterium]|jgi:hypothetical protein|nr:PUR family DNA/RNA-binding protein [Dysgonamonadaceae bacterium]